MLFTFLFFLLIIPLVPPSFHEKLMPVMTKYSNANANRWGHLVFMCNRCSEKFSKFKASFKSQYKDGASITAKNVVSDPESTTKPVVEPITQEKSVDQEGLKVLLNDFKTSLMSSVQSLISSRLAEVPLHDPKVKHRFPTPSSDSLMSEPVSVSTTASTPQLLSCFLNALLRTPEVLTED